MPTHYRGSKATTRALNAYINLMRCASSVLARTSRHLEFHQLTAGQFGVLEALLHLGPLKQRTLAEKLLCGGANITMVVNHLEKRGLVRRERRTDDRRAIDVHLTPAGRALITKVFEKHVEGIVAEMAALQANEQEWMREFCRRIGRGYDEKLAKVAIKTGEDQ
jgi:MarR family transcriptional regulator, 2-MHQ and catechol-resistance regulon repressor